MVVYDRGQTKFHVKILQRMSLSGFSGPDPVLSPLLLESNTYIVFDICTAADDKFINNLVPSSSRRRFLTQHKILKIIFYY